MKDINQLVKELNQSTLSIKKKGKKYIVKDITQFDGNYGLMSEKQIRENFE